MSPREVTVFGALGVVVGDHMQQLEYCRHLGNQANMADRSSWIDKSERVSFGAELWDHKLVRRRDQTNIVVDMIWSELEQKLDDNAESKRVRAVAAVAGGDDQKVAAAREALLANPSHVSRLQTIRRRYGIREGPDVFSQVDFDPHFLCFRDPDHLLDMGLTRNLLEHVVEALDAKAAKELSNRLSHFPWPRNFSRITFDLSKTVGSRYSMLFLRKMLLVGVCVLEDLCLPDHYLTLCRLLSLRNSLYSTHSHTPDSLKSCQRQAEDLIALVSKTFGEKAVDKPNWHNLLALVYKDLRIVNNILLLRTNQWEAKHQSAFTDRFIAVFSL